MAIYHPKLDLLMSYAAGSSGESWGLAIATHMALCPDCRSIVSLAEEMGGSLLEDVAPEPMNSSSWEQLASQLGSPEAVQIASPETATPSAQPTFPEPLRRYVGNDAKDIPWKRLSGVGYQHLIPTRDLGQARLLKILAGRTIPQHGHRGRELTLVLSGFFSDHLGEFTRGDLEDTDEDLIHQPATSAHTDCICLAVTDSPLRFTSLIPRLVQPFFRI